MRATLFTPVIYPNMWVNTQMVIDAAGGLEGAEGSLVLFPEAVITGLINCDNPAVDLQLAQPVPGIVSAGIAGTARFKKLWLGLGLLERDGDCIYDSALLFNPAGEIALHYRRNHPGWHGKNVDKAVYREGDSVPAADTPFGRVIFLLCGDLFDDEVLERARQQHPDLLLFPFARQFSNGSYDFNRWRRDEEPAYLERIKLLGIPALMTNYLASPQLPGDQSFGGAWSVGRSGKVIDYIPLGCQGFLGVDLDDLWQL